MLFCLLLLKKFFRLNVVMCSLLVIIGVVGCFSVGRVSGWVICRCGVFLLFICMMFFILCRIMLVCRVVLVGR